MSDDMTTAEMQTPAARMAQMRNRIAALEAERAQLRQNVAELLAEFTDLRDRAVEDAAEIARLRESCAQARRSRREWVRFATGLLRERNQVQS